MWIESHYLTPQDILNKTNRSGDKVRILLGNNTFSDFRLKWIVLVLPCCPANVLHA
jgi:hypothetical protein